MMTRQDCRALINGIADLYLAFNIEVHEWFKIWWKVFVIQSAIILYTSSK